MILYPKSYLSINSILKVTIIIHNHLCTSLNPLFISFSDDLNYESVSAINSKFSATSMGRYLYLTLKQTHC